MNNNIRLMAAENCEKQGRAFNIYTNNITHSIIKSGGSSQNYNILQEKKKMNFDNLLKITDSTFLYLTNSNNSYGFTTQGKSMTTKSAEQQLSSDKLSRYKIQKKIAAAAEARQQKYKRQKKVTATQEGMGMGMEMMGSENKSPKEGDEWTRWDELEMMGSENKQPEEGDETAAHLRSMRSKPPVKVRTFKNIQSSIKTLKIVDDKNNKNNIEHFILIINELKDIFFDHYKSPNTNTTGINSYDSVEDFTSRIQNLPLTLEYSQDQIKPFIQDSDLIFSLVLNCMDDSHRQEIIRISYSVSTQKPTIQFRGITIGNNTYELADQEQVAKPNVSYINYNKQLKIFFDFFNNHDKWLTESRKKDNIAINDTLAFINEKISQQESEIVIKSAIIDNKGRGIKQYIYIVGFIVIGIILYAVYKLYCLRNDFTKCQLKWKAGLVGIESRTAGLNMDDADGVGRVDLNFDDDHCNDMFKQDFNSASKAETWLNNTFSQNTDEYTQEWLTEHNIDFTMNGLLNGFFMTMPGASDVLGSMIGVAGVGIALEFYQMFFREINKSKMNISSKEQIIRNLNEMKNKVKGLAGKLNLSTLAGTEALYDIQKHVTSIQMGMSRGGKTFKHKRKSMKNLKHKRKSMKNLKHKRKSKKNLKHKRKTKRKSFKGGNNENLNTFIKLFTCLVKETVDSGSINMLTIVNNEKFKNLLGLLIHNRKEINNVP